MTYKDAKQWNTDKGAIDEFIKTYHVKDLNEAYKSFSSLKTISPETAELVKKSYIELSKQKVKTLKKVNMTTGGGNYLFQLNVNSQQTKIGVTDKEISAIMQKLLKNHYSKVLDKETSEVDILKEYLEIKSLSTNHKKNYNPNFDELGKDLGDKIKSAYSPKTGRLNKKTLLDIKVNNEKMERITIIQRLIAGGANGNIQHAYKSVQKELVAANDKQLNTMVESYVSFVQHSQNVSLRGIFGFKQNKGKDFNHASELLRRAYGVDDEQLPRVKKSIDAEVAGLLTGKLSNEIRTQHVLYQNWKSETTVKFSSMIDVASKNAKSNAKKSPVQGKATSKTKSNVNASFFTPGKAFKTNKKSFTSDLETDQQQQSNSKGMGM